MYKHTKGSPYAPLFLEVVTAPSAQNPLKDLMYNLCPYILGGFVPQIPLKDSLQHVCPLIQDAFCPIPDIQ